MDYSCRVQGGYSCIAPKQLAALGLSTLRSIEPETQPVEFRLRHRPFEVQQEFVVGRLRYAVPQWRADIPDALARARQRLSQAKVEGQTWYWPEGEVPPGAAPADEVRLLAPFDPVVWDRRRFELLWGWAYRFEAYTPEPKRKLGYYALPLLWRDRIVGWGNLSMRNAGLEAAIGYVGAGPPRQRAFKRELDAEVERVRTFLLPA